MSAACANSRVLSTVGSCGTAALAYSSLSFLDEAGLFLEVYTSDEACDNFRWGPAPFCGAAAGGAGAATPPPDPSARSATPPAPCGGGSRRACRAVEPPPPNRNESVQGPRAAPPRAAVPTSGEAGGGSRPGSREWGRRIHRGQRAAHAPGGPGYGPGEVRVAHSRRVARFGRVACFDRVARLGRVAR